MGKVAITKAGTEALAMIDGYNRTGYGAILAGAAVSKLARDGYAVKDETSEDGNRRGYWLTAEGVLAHGRIVREAAEDAARAHYANATSEDVERADGAGIVYTGSKRLLLAMIERAYPDVDASHIYDVWSSNGDMIADAVESIRDEREVSAWVEHCDRIEAAYESMLKLFGADEFIIRHYMAIACVDANKAIGKAQPDWSATWLTAFRATMDALCKGFLANKAEVAATPVKSPTVNERRTAQLNAACTVRRPLRKVKSTATVRARRGGAW